MPLPLPFAHRKKIEKPISKTTVRNALKPVQSDPQVLLYILTKFQTILSTTFREFSNEQKHTIFAATSIIKQVSIL